MLSQLLSKSLRQTFRDEELNHGTACGSRKHNREIDHIRRIRTTTSHVFVFLNFAPNFYYVDLADSLLLQTSRSPFILYPYYTVLVGSFSYAVYGMTRMVFGHKTLW
jgi:hypothetical protein